MVFNGTEQWQLSRGIRGCTLDGSQRETEDSIQELKGTPKEKAIQYKEQSYIKEKLIFNLTFIASSMVRVQSKMV